jgi:hypothetical protein
MDSFQYPKGYAPGGEFVDRGVPTGFRVGVIQRVDEINLKVDIRLLTGGFRPEVDLTQAICGPRSFWGGVPEVGSLVLLSYRKIHQKLAEAVIIGFIPIGNRLGLRFDPYAATDPNGISEEDEAEALDQFGPPQRVKRLRLSPGDVGGMSSGGAEMVLSKGIRMTNRAGDLIELRDEERTLVTQAIHRFDSDGGVKRYSGPVRRQAFYLPIDTFTVDASGNKTLKTEGEGYFGRDELQAAGPGATAATRFANESGQLLPQFNDETTYPSVTYSNGKQVYYAGVSPNISPEKPIDSGGGNVFTEVRTEIAHDTDLVQDVEVEIDGFTMNPRRVFVEHVMGTLVGNDAYSTQGIRNYGKPLRPQLWTAAGATTPGRMTFEEVVRGQAGDRDVQTAAGAYLLKILAPLATGDEVPFAVAVQKQGKLLVQVPKPVNDFYGDNVKGVSADVNLLGALKLYVGAASPDVTSVYAKLEGGIKAEIGRNTDTGNSLDVTYLGPVSAKFVGTEDASGNGMSTSVSGGISLSSTGDFTQDAGGSIFQTADGGFVQQADKFVVSATSGYTLSTGGFQQQVVGLSYLTYALLKTETISAGGEVKTVLAGASVETVAAGAKTVTVAAGALALTAGAAIAATAGAGMSLTAGGALAATAGAAISQTAGAAIALTAGAVMTLTAPVGILLTSTNIQLGGPPGVLGVVRGVPAMPPGMPTLDYVTGLPLLGSALVRSILCRSRLQASRACSPRLLPGRALRVSAYPSSPSAWARG